MHHINNDVVPTKTLGRKYVEVKNFAGRKKDG